jgi:hypothetical protein
MTLALAMAGAAMRAGMWWSRASGIFEAARAETAARRWTTATIALGALATAAAAFALWLDFGR